MSLLDLSLLAIIGVSALFGAMRGFVGVLASLAAWLLAGWAAFHFGAETARWMSSDGPPTATELLGGYALSFVAVMLFVGIVGWVVRQFIKTVGLSGVDRALGLVLGLVRGATVVQWAGQGWQARIIARRGTIAKVQFLHSPFRQPHAEPPRTGQKHGDDR